MFNKIFYKQNIRRVVPGTCLVVGDAGAGARSLAKVKLTLQLRRGCWRTTSRKVAVFTFQEASGHVSSHALLDLEYLFRCSSKPSAGTMQVKICVVLRCGGKRVARADLEDFLGQLLRGGRLDSFFLYIHEEKVALLQANQPITDQGTEWLFEGEPRGTHTMVKAETLEEYDDTNELEDYTDEHNKEWKAYLEKVFSVEDEDDIDELEDSDEEKYKEWKAYLEKVFSVEDDDDIDELEDSDEEKYKEWKAYLEKVFSVEDEDDIDELEDSDEEKYKEWKAYLEKVFSVEDEDDIDELEDSDEEKYKEWKAYLEKVFSVEDDDDANEVTSELREASDAGNEGAEEVTSELREASDAGYEGAEEVTSELREASDAGNEGAEEVTSELREASDAGNEGAEEVTSELQEASDAGSEGAEEVTSELQEASDAGNEAAREATSPDQEVPHQGESSAPVAVSATPAAASHAYRSLAVPHRFISRLAGPEDRHLEDLRRSYGVQITLIKRTLHVKGHRDSVLQCHNFIRAKIAEWRRCEAAEAH
ncbi:sarcoplasmic reticulum histidine-rich calcium-binding protein-like isoform X21 [Eriocheir sinensis]|uniref:sarcoplasmic reticulum histidine-rich calcium-binding protein-like isoform X20 n=1 Tax=Eriocheir sinensis TaxID=95602 RepID=UPI0021C9B964|nr:sarcoplasmic reticulum histidine-rich calcium-binding protein-like isoform X20 [Eriocheir sinensis]XP_050722449.1 sarcoplasmic reticulum histidine-rich calcium-binding protein-like isoform X21 [Eriocheir sinensis]